MAVKWSPVHDKQALLAGVKFFCAGLVLLPCLSILPQSVTFAGNAAPLARDSVSDALAGHGAEMRQFGAGADPWRRPLFFDPVDIESTPAGVPCDHLLARRPEVDGGVGWVVLMHSGPKPGRRLRFWRVPAQQPVLRQQAVGEALRFALTATGDGAAVVIAARSFVWCRD